MKSITVLMSTYNGEKYLSEQLDSLLSQRNTCLSILVRDDGSSDSTKNILREYQRNGYLTWYSGENLKPALSFLDLINKAPDSEYYAFCDQDDIWNDDKLSNAINILEKYGDNTVPRLYCASYQLVDANLNNLPDNLHVTTTTFEASLVSSCCTGCTVVFNRALLQELRKGVPQYIVMHDDWAHKVCLALGGTVFFDKSKVLKYRQHDQNADGGIHPLKCKIRGVIKRIANRDCIRSNQLKEIYKIYGNDMESDKKNLLKFVADYKQQSLSSKLRLMFSRKIKTPYKRLNYGFRFAILFNYF